MKIKSLLSVIACGIASQFMTSCGSTGKYYDFSTPTTTYNKTKPVSPIVSAEAAEVTVANAAPQAEASVPVLEANASKGAGSPTRPIRTAPLTTPAVEQAVAQSSSNLTNLSNELAAAKTKKDIKVVAKKITREAKAAKASGLNYYVKLGLVLLIAGALVAAIGLGLIGSVVAIVGLVLILLGVLEM